MFIQTGEINYAMAGLSRKVPWPGPGLSYLAATTTTTTAVAVAGAAAAAVAESIDSPRKQWGQFLMYRHY